MFDAKSDARKMVEEINSENLPFTLEIINIEETNEEYVVAKWKWMDATYFSGVSITSEIKEFRTYVKLDNNGRYRWFDSTEEINQSLGIGGYNFTGTSFYGKQWNFSKVIVLGKNNETNEKGIVQFKLNTATIHKPIKEWLKNHNYKKRHATLKEHITGFKMSMNPITCTVTGIIFTILGSACAITGGVLIFKALNGESLTIKTIKNGIETVNNSISGTITFGTFFALFGSFFLLMGIPLLVMFIPILKKEWHKK